MPDGARDGVRDRQDGGHAEEQYGTRAPRRQRGNQAGRAHAREHHAASHEPVSRTDDPRGRRQERRGDRAAVLPLGDPSGERQATHGACPRDEDGTRRRRDHAE